MFEETTQQIVSIRNGHTDFNWINILWIVYGIITLFLLIRSILAFLAIRKIKGEKFTYQHHKVIVTKENIPPFSFWNTIYIGKNYVKDDHIDPRIFLHEKSHIDQKHSIDVILIDLLKIFTWFNPIVYLYKKAVITNHEFLADEAVLKNKFNSKEYQSLILDEIISRQNLHLTHSFNFINTKKRFIMMNAKKTKFSLLRKTAGITTLIASIALFSEKTYASEVINTKNAIASSHEMTTVQEIPNVKQEVQAKSFTNEKELNETSDVQSELKKEKLRIISDTITPKVTTHSTEDNNTNTSLNSNQNLTQPEYPGGLRALREKVGKNMDTSKFTFQKGVIKSVAYIHIDATGKTTDIKVSGDNETLNTELLKTVTEISNETTWKPATENGKAIAAVLKVPATMSFGQ
nr:M56 family metallopeptidase [uncultured Chryseobacterium sp.]